ncbi:MAG: AMP-binding protein, partial [Chloroflexi bacterium]|nr:AMP-binding protein [Chloroflexota bacterium]
MEQERTIMQAINPLVLRECEAARKDPDAYWARAAEQLHWFRRWDRVFESNAPSFRWFVGGETNLAYNCLDHHVNRGWGGHAALVYANERGERRTFTYAQLRYEVSRVAAALRGMGVEKGDRVTIYMPMIPEAAVAMLACARIGAIHSIVFGGFSPTALADRIVDSACTLVVTTDGAFRGKKSVPLKSNADEAMPICARHGLLVRE